MGRLNRGKNSASSTAQTMPMRAASPRKPFARSRLTVLVLVLVADALTALPLGWMAARYHLASDLISLFSSFGPANQSSPPLPARAPNPTALQSPTHSPTVEVWEDTFHRTDQLFWGRASDGGAWKADASSSPAFSIAGQEGLISSARGAYTALLGPRLANAELLVTFSISRFNGENNMGVVLEYASATR